MKNDRFRFDLRKLDVKTGCFTRQDIFWVDKLSIIEELLGEQPPPISTSQAVSNQQYRKLATFLSLEISLDDITGEIIHLHPDTIHDPNSHTGRELLLMLDGKKPFSSFVEVFPDDTELEIIPEKYFEPYVSDGKIIKIEHFEKTDFKGNKILRHVFFALPGEEWRANAYIMLFGLTRKYGWKPEFELIQGFLLGYEKIPEVGDGAVMSCL